MTKIEEHIVGKGLNKSKLTVLRKFIRREDLDDIAAILNENEIPFQAWEKKEVLIPIIIGDELVPRFWIEVENFNLSRVNELLEASARENLQDIDLENHYLNDLNDMELKEIIQKPEEWNPGSVLASKMILEKRGIAYTED